jgi:putative protein-disulfide isomerase
MSSDASTIRDDASSWAIDYVQRSEELFEPTEPDEVRIDLVTDPWSVWCWGLETVARAIANRYPSITFRPIVGGMFERLPHKDHPEFNLHRFLTRVQRITGMPLATNAFDDGGPESTYPACVHAHALRLLDNSNARLGLRKLREAAWLDGRDISQASVAADVAGEAGYDEDTFRDALATGEPEREFEQRLDALEHRDVTAYPTMVLTNGDEHRRLEGYVPLPGVLDAVEHLTGQTHVAGPAPDVIDVLDAKHRVATREVAEAIGTSIEVAAERLASRADDGHVTRTRHQNGDTWTLIE